MSACLSFFTSLFVILYIHFYGYGAHRDLHSFPTRRSSDLAGAAGGASRSVLRRPRCSAKLSGDLEQQRRNHQAGRIGDRKSTRLNSSHLVISYAVFCLKKKNKKKNTIYHYRLNNVNIACSQ